MSDRLKEKIKNEKNPLLQAALEYLLLYKWSVIPLNGKKPYQGWAAYQKRRPTEAEVRQWWHRYPEANIGIICGKVSGLVVLDLDGEEGMQSFNKKGYAPITVAAKTGNGTHFYYLHPGHEVHNFTSKEPGLDFRGDGGYVVAPPSIHPVTKSAYEWLLPPHQEELAPCPGWLLDMLGAKKPAYAGKPKEDSLVKALNGLPEGERDDGIFRYACRLRGKGISRLEAEVLICSSAASCRPPFPKEQALRKIEQAWKYDGPAISSPEDINLENVFEKPSLLFLAKLKKSDVGEYAKIKQSLKGKINLNDLEKAVNSQIAKNQGMHVVKNEAEENDLSKILPDLPVEYLKSPSEWSVNQKGIYKIIYKKETSEKIYASAVPVVLTKRLKNIDTAEEKVEIAYYRDGKWHFIIADRAVVFNSRTLIQLANKGLLVSSESARHLIRYLDDLERENLDNLPLRKSVSHMGWIDKKEFFPGAEGEVVLDIEEGGSSSVLRGYRQIGTLEKWLEMIMPLRKYPIARFMISAAFATPLLSILKQRVAIIHSWGDSRGGKTAALKAALSVWGDPEIIMSSFNATKVGLETIAALYNDLPLGIDEKQVVADKQGFVESLIYMLGLGKGKIKGKKSGGIREAGYWHTIGISTGEHPISTDSSTAGIKTRVLEIYGRPIPDEKLAELMHSVVRENCGLAGPRFIRWIIAFMQNNSEQIIEDFKEWKKIIEKNYLSKISSHISTITTICLADYYASQYIFAQDEQLVRSEIMEMVDYIIKNLETSEEADEGVRALEFFQSWYGVHQESFTYSYVKERYGYENNGILYIFPTIFERAMLEGKFNSAQILRNWGEKDWILKEKRKNEGRTRLKVRKSFESGKTSSFIALNMNSFAQCSEEEDISQEEIPF